MELSCVALAYRPDTPAALKLAGEVAKWFSKKGIRVFSFKEQKVVPGTRKLHSPQAMNQLDLVVVLGGDGTYLHAVRWLKGRRVPVLGVNMGSLGFLTDIRKEDIFQVLSGLMDDAMELRHRSMLSVRIWRGRKVVDEYLALNDIVLERGAQSQLIRVKISSEKFEVYSLKADGVIVATPTGSTAYNLAAGGPVLHPEVNSVVVTPICPHSLTSRPVILPDDRILSLQVEGPKRKGTLSIDGAKIGDVTDKDRIEILRSERDHIMVRDPNHNYFELLRNKLRFGQRE
jgi:NAD+ kinase